MLAVARDKGLVDGCFANDSHNLGCSMDGHKDLVSRGVCVVLGGFGACRHHLWEVTPIKWPCDWNRPLSEEELAIAKRLKRAPDDGEGTFKRVGQVVGDIKSGLSDQRLVGGVEERRTGDASESVARDWFGVFVGPSTGNGQAE